MSCFCKEEPFYNGKVYDEAEEAQFREYAAKLLADFKQHPDPQEALTYAKTDQLRLLALKKTLQAFSIWPVCYSLAGRDQEDTAGLDYIDGSWTTYSFERGHRDFLHPFKTFDLAALDLLRILADTNEDEDRMCYYYHKLSNAILDAAFEDMVRESST